VHKEFLSQSQTVNEDAYKGVLQRLLEGIRRSAEWRRTNSPASRKFRAKASKTKQNKNLHCFLFKCKFVVRKEFLSQSQTVNQDAYKGVLQRLLEGIRRCRPALWATGKWFLLHNNARPHTILSVKEF